MIFRTTLTAFALMTSIAFAQGTGAGGHFVDAWDLDGDGAVSLAEATERRGDVFVTFDADDNGILSAEEYDLFDEARANDMANNDKSGQGAGQGGGQGRNPANGMKRAFTDANNDGEVTLAEFMASVPSWFAGMDTSGDGMVTVDDFGK